VPWPGSGLGLRRRTPAAGLPRVERRPGGAASRAPGWAASAWSRTWSGHGRIQFRAANASAPAGRRIIHAMRNRRHKTSALGRCGLTRFVYLCVGLACALPVCAATDDASARGSVDESGDASRWTVALEAVAFERSDGVSRTLVSRLPGATTTFHDTQSMAGTEAFNSDQFDHGHAVGPRFTLTYRVDAGHRLELSYLAVQNLDAKRTVGPDNPVDWYVMRAPGFWQTQDFYYQGMSWAATTDVYGLEANARFAFPRNLELLAGFRWLRLNDGLTGSLTPADRNEPAWKTGACASGTSADEILASIGGMTLPGTAQACAAGGAVDGYPPFWTTTTTNDLFGLQAGAEGTLLTIGRLALGGVAKAGIYDNHARQSAAVSMKKQVYHASAGGNRMAFVGQGGIHATYTVTRKLSGKLGYELLWLDRVALAPGQISKTVSGANPTSETVTGVDSGSSVLLHGLTAGFVYSF
jgi:hypothetical protein